jgi:TM2 domain-containing membrane protein YozV
MGSAKPTKDSSAFGRFIFVGCAGMFGFASFYSECVITGIFVGLFYSAIAVFIVMYE